MPHLLPVAVVPESQQDKTPEEGGDHKENKKTEEIPRLLLMDVLTATQQDNPSTVTKYRDEVPSPQSQQQLVSSTLHQ